jgi:hypothetical protein
MSKDGSDSEKKIRDVGHEQEKETKFESANDQQTWNRQRRKTW